MKSSTKHEEELERLIEAAKDQLERAIRKVVDTYGGFKLTIEDAPTRADDQRQEADGAVRITIRPKYRSGK
jgi:hypothetical protein